MKKILVTLPVTEEQKRRFAQTAPDAEFIYRTKEELTKEETQTVNGLIGNVPPSMLAGNCNLEWVQLNSAGTDGYLKEGVLPEQAVLTNATGAYGVAIAEHMTGQLLMLYKKFPAYLDNQKEHSWRDEGDVRSIYGSRILIVGMGDIGTEFAVRMKAFGAYVTGMRRTVQGKPDCVDEMYTIDRLEEQLPLADTVAICLPGIKETYHMFSEAKLRLMKKGAVLINVGRGNIVDTAALVSVLKDGHLGGAAVDVCEQEPLPSEEELWACPNILITPHISGGFHLPHTLERIVEISTKNLSAYVNGRPFASVVDRRTGYKISGADCG